MRGEPDRAGPIGAEHRPNATSPLTIHEFEVSRTCGATRTGTGRLSPPRDQRYRAFRVAFRSPPPPDILTPDRLIKGTQRAMRNREQLLSDFSLGPPPASPAARRAKPRSFVHRLFRAFEMRVRKVSKDGAELAR